ncbi:SPFH domain-containing protein [Rhizomicrobium electricum]|jgi:regulator of protease activity HflC (stomatin/prohibitin superfamily)|uniref:SPFH domain-containing protein n=1 Tax=Rhizomicrobium electricum TaxID=480070 RepID=A0ABP3PG10_9PROT|nr:SPFH domain-containing protein [Rhizomicrobium electricum]NIJ48150.1 regulator of protease activity HflC (stomatin/prohibitin superfamily) [Rhizomicrobium electricum]
MADAIQRSVEKRGGGSNGWPLVLTVLALLAISIALFAAQTPLGAVTLVAGVLVAAGFYTLQPNTAAVLTLFGKYLSTDRSQGLRWVPFWIGRKIVSVRARNVTCEKLKVNDNRGNPIEIAANVVWRVDDTARAVFDVDRYTDFANIQIETGLRVVASKFSYDHPEGDQPTLRASGDHVAEILRAELQERVGVAGLTIDDARISHLAYAPEIAGAMLRRQQAQAILEARKLIVEGAVGMVELALTQLSERHVVELDDERKATMVSNLMVVLCSDHDAQPVLNTGTLYG